MSAVPQKALAEYANVPSLFGAIISRRLATLHELDTVYGLEDAMDLMEIIAVQNYNEWAAMEARR